MIKKIFSASWVFLVLLAIYLPIIILAIYSFTDSTTIGAIRGFSLHNYETLFTTKELLEMIVDTLVLALVVAIMTVLLGTTGAIGAFYSKRLPKAFIRNANQIPVVNADVVTGFSICILLIVAFGIDKSTYIPLVIGQVT